MAGEIILTLIGNLTADPETREVGGATVASFTIASTARAYDKAAGEFVDGTTTFVRASAWRELAEHIAASLSKGSRVIAQGRFSQREYETREGEKRTVFELEVDAIGPDLRYATVQVQRTQTNRNQQARREQFVQQSAPQQQRQQPAQSKPDPWSAPGAYDDETPF